MHYFSVTFPNTGGSVMDKHKAKRLINNLILDQPWCLVNQRRAESVCRWQSQGLNRRGCVTKSKCHSNPASAVSSSHFYWLLNREICFFRSKTVGGQLVWQALVMLLPSSFKSVWSKWAVLLVTIITKHQGHEHLRPSDNHFGWLFKEYSWLERRNLHNDTLPQTKNLAGNTWAIAGKYATGHPVPPAPFQLSSESKQLQLNN